VSKVRAALGSFADRVTGRESARLRTRIRDLRTELAESRRRTTSQVEARSEYTVLAPAPGAALSLFDGSWSSRLSGRDGPGRAELFADPRIDWLAEQVGDLNGIRVLELGPLEAGHTWMLEQRGARVTAVEANHSAFLRCLTVKNLLGMSSEFVLGDFARALPAGGPWDLVVASGVLYHMVEPERLVADIAAASDRLFLWTHYFDDDPSAWHPDAASRIGTKWRTGEQVERRCNGVDLRLVPMLYEEALGWSGFCGGPERHSLWMRRDDLFDLLRSFGFDDIRTAFDQPGSPNGPSLALYATRTPGSAGLGS
jgi:hypothetical protein